MAASLSADFHRDLSVSLGVALSWKGSGLRVKTVNSRPDPEAGSGVRKRPAPVTEQGLCASRSAGHQEGRQESSSALSLRPPAGSSCSAWYSAGRGVKLTPSAQRRRAL